LEVKVEVKATAAVVVAVRATTVAMAVQATVVVATVQAVTVDHPERIRRRSHLHGRFLRCWRR
jgi:hypothetical protein